MICDRFVIDPQTTQACLAAEDDRASFLGRGGTIGLVCGAKIHRMPRPRTPGLPYEVLREIGGKIPGVRVDVDDHRKRVCDSVAWEVEPGVKPTSWKLVLRPQSSDQTADPPRVLSPHPDEIPPVRARACS